MITYEYYKQFDANKLDNIDKIPKTQNTKTNSRVHRKSEQIYNE